MKQEASQPRPARPRNPAYSAQLAHAAHEAGPATLYRPRAHKPLTSRTRPSAVKHRAPPHQDKLTNGPPLSAAQLQRRRLPHAPSTMRPGANRRAGVGPGSRKSHDLVPPCATPTLPHASRQMHRTHHHRLIAVRHWSPWSSAIKANVHEP